MLEFDPILVADEIERKTCVLLVGPDLFRLNERPINQAMRENLAGKYGAYIEHYYVKEDVPMVYRLQWRAEEQADIIDNFKAFVEADPTAL